jgi:hypothetical protein
VDLHVLAQFLQVVLRLDQLVDLLDELGLGLGHDSLDLVNLLVDDLVDVLHVLEHLVRLLVQVVQLLLVALQLDLAHVHLLPRVVLLLLEGNTVHNLFVGRDGAGGVEVGVLVLAVVLLDGLLALLHHGAAELL